MLLTIGFSFALAPLFTRLCWQPHGGLALANTRATSLEGLGLMWWMRRKLHGLALTRMWDGLLRTALASAVMGAVLAVWLQSTSGRSAWIVGLGGVALGGAVFAAAAFALRV